MEMDSIVMEELKGSSVFGPPSTPNGITEDGGGGSGGRQPGVANDGAGGSTGGAGADGSPDTATNISSSKGSSGTNNSVSQQLDGEMMVDLITLEVHRRWWWRWWNRWSRNIY